MRNKLFHGHVGIIVAYHPYLTAVVPIFVYLFIITNLCSHVIRAKPFDVGIDVHKQHESMINVIFASGIRLIWVSFLGML